MTLIYSLISLEDVAQEFPSTVMCRVSNLADHMFLLISEIEQVILCQMLSIGKQEINEFQSRHLHLLFHIIIINDNEY